MAESFEDGAKRQDTGPLAPKERQEVRYVVETNKTTHHVRAFLKRSLAWAAGAVAAAVGLSQLVDRLFGKGH